MDRQGVDLLFTTSLQTMVMPVAVDASPTRPMTELAQILRHTQPELVWLFVEECPLEHLAALVSLIRRAGVEVLQIEQDLDIHVATLHAGLGSPESRGAHGRCEP